MISFIRSTIKLAILATIIGFFVSSCQTNKKQIVITKEASVMEQYAASELQRYIYQLSGELLPITNTESIENMYGFVIGQIGSTSLSKKFENTDQIRFDTNKPGKQGYRLKKISREGSEVIVITGGDPEGCLYGVYGLLDDYYGMGFYFSGNTYPPKTKGLKLIEVDEIKTPATYIRGILPWTNFPQAATSYSWEDWTYIIDQMARMRMNFIHIHNYSGGADHNEMFANFENKGHLSRVWMATARSGHGWSCPGWDVNNYRFGSADLFDDYDFGADCALHNETLTNKEVFRKGVSEFQRVIAYAHLRGVKIGLGLDINQIPKEYNAEASNPLVVKERAQQIANDYPDLDYLLCFQSEHIARDEVARVKWRGIFDAFYDEIKKKSLSTKIAVSGWGLAAKDVATLPKDVICAPIASYTADFISGAAYGDREYWGCPWLEKDGDCSQYYYPYTINLSNTIEGWQKRAPNMKGLYSLTWRITDAIDPKISYIAKAPWDDANKYSSSEAVYREYAEDNYGNENAKVITEIINENEPWVDSQGECRPTLAFSEKAKKGRANICKLDYFQFLSDKKSTRIIQAEKFSVKNGWVKPEKREDGTTCIGGINSADWLCYPNIDFGAGMSHIKYRFSSNFFNASFEIRLDSLNGKLLQMCPIERTFGWDKWKELKVTISEANGIHDLYLIFHPSPLPDAEIVKTEKQLEIIDDCLKKAASQRDKDRLEMLRCRIAATRDNLILNRDFENYKWSDLPGTMESFISNFNYRINDISSLGNIISVQNRFVSQNYVEKEEELASKEAIKPVTNLAVRGTKDGVFIEWEYENLNVKGFNVYRDNKKVSKNYLPAGTKNWAESINGNYRYSISAIDVNGKESLLSVPIKCAAGNADKTAPHIVIVSPPTSVFSGQDAWIKVRLLDGRTYHSTEALLYYRRPGNSTWKKQVMQQRVKAVFVAEISKNDISELGVEYYIEAGDGSKNSRFPSEGSLSLTKYDVQSQAQPATPKNFKSEKAKLTWDTSTNNDVFWYRIYRDNKPDFKVGPVNFLTYVAKGTTSFYDNGYNLAGNKMEGMWYYRISAIDKMGIESEPTNAVQIASKDLINLIERGEINYVPNESFRKEAARYVE